MAKDSQYCQCGCYEQAFGKMIRETNIGWILVTHIKELKAIQRAYRESRDAHGERAGAIEPRDIQNGGGKQRELAREEGRTAAPD